MTEPLETYETHPSLEKDFADKFSHVLISSGGFLTDTANKIIMGTFPPPKTSINNYGSDYFYYPSNRNQFWNIIDIVNNAKQITSDKLKFTKSSSESIKTNVSRKAQFCLQQNWAFMDFYSSVSRKEKDSSKDQDLIGKENIIENKIFYNYLNLNKNIKHIFCLYKLAFTELIKHLTEDNYKLIKIDDTQYRLIFSEKEILIHLLHPPTRSKIKLNIRAEQYSNYLYN